MEKLFGGKAVVSGVGQSQIGRNLNRSGLELTAEACLRAIADAGLAPEDIDGLSTYPGAGSTDRLRGRRGVRGARRARVAG
jgi:acetyl-CoA acetyltransferase